MAQKTSEQLWDEHISDMVEASALAHEILQEAYRREMFVPLLVYSIVSTYSIDIRHKKANVVNEELDWLARERIEKLEKENEMLKEVVKAAWGCVNRTVDCHECRLVCGGCTLLSAMKDCGIEVD